MVAMNVLAFGWFNYQESFSEPEKRQFQAASRGVKMLRLLNEREPIMDVSVHVQDQTGTVDICHTIGPLKDHELVRDVVAGMKRLGREGNVRIDRQKVKYAYWVYLKSTTDVELEKIIKDLVTNGITDYHRNDRNELSLGIYNGIQGAKRRQMDIAEFGYSPLVGPLYRTETQYWIEVADTNYSFHKDDAWDSYLAQYPDTQRKSTKCDLVTA
jgi:hypothetical protein